MQQHVATVALGAVERLVGRTMQLRGVGGMLRIQADTDAYVAAVIASPRAGSAARCGQHRSPRRRAAPGVAQAPLDDRELVAAQPRQRVGLPQTGLDPVRHRDQQAVADDVAVAVVDGLEMVQIEIVKRDEAACPLGTAQRLIEPVVEQPPIG